MQTFFNRIWHQEFRLFHSHEIGKLKWHVFYWPGFAIFALIISTYFFCLWVVMTLGWKQKIHLVEKPGFLLRGFVTLWNSLPNQLKRWLSLQNKRLYEMPFTTFYIRPYLFRNYELHETYLEKFRPYKNRETYTCFQDFFARELAEKKTSLPETISPCEGLIVDKHNFHQKSSSTVKGCKMESRSIFGSLANEIPNSYSFLNIFLSNRHYHHVHSPVTGVVRDIERIKGNLIVLRPWFYKKFPTKPAIVNERVIIKIEDNNKKSWFLCLVGGPVVNSILLSQPLQLGALVEAGQKLATFELGSTCCLALPHESELTIGQEIKLFQQL